MGIAVMSIFGLMAVYCLCCVIVRAVHDKNPGGVPRLNKVFGYLPLIYEEIETKSEEGQPNDAPLKTPQDALEEETQKKHVVLQVHGAMRSLSREARLDPSKIGETGIEADAAPRGDDNWYVVREVGEKRAEPRSEESRNVEPQNVESRSEGKKSANPTALAKANSAIPWWKFMLISLAATILVRAIILACGYIVLLKYQPELSWNSHLSFILERWGHYVDISRYGQANMFEIFALSPLFAALASGAERLFNDALVPTLAFSLLTSAVAMTLLYRLMMQDGSGDYSWSGALFMLFMPFGFMTPVIPLFLMLSLSAVYFSRKGRYLIACIAGGLSAATLLPGILIFIPVLCEMMKTHKLGGGKKPKYGLKTLYLLIIPVGLIGYFAYFYYNSYGGVSDIFRALKEQYTSENHMGIYIMKYLSDAQNGGAASIESLLLLLTTLLSAFILCVSARRMRLSYLMYATVFLLFSIFSGRIGLMLWLSGAAFVFYISEAAVFRSISRYVALAVSSQLMLCFYLLFEIGFTVI